ncbi:MAG: sodium:proton exchanger [Candidatus Dadabacteria bacterium]|nr:sodium:proton exchanger [Candidatus Dadabacteria bacterium]NIS08468.1 sodium:proton exchanger [Candidatus Dadabacteria bacterium]NIY21956.1 sodium:proton exchanger [Candidatus Dadabacteria bacterium]
MDNISLNLLILGILLLAGYAAHVAGRRVHIPRVTLLLLIGLITGPYFLHLVPAEITEWFPQIAHMALAMVGFLLGERFYGKDFQTTGRVVLWVSITQTLITVIIVFALMLFTGAGAMFALLLAGISSATDPAATYDVVNEKKARGPLTKTLLGVVALDDAWGIIIFSLILVFVELVLGNGNAGFILANGLWEVAGAVLLGIILGIPMAWLTGRIKKGEPSMLEAVGFVFLCGGLALYMHVSYLLACMVLGAVVANRAKHHTKPFRDIRGIAEPFLALFFLLAGYKFDLPAIMTVGAITFFYIISRFAGKYIGGFLGGRISGASDVIQKRIGLCLIPQAGVAVGMALLIVERLPDPGIQILQIVIASTIIFEILGPLITMWQLKKAGEISQL